MSLRGRLGVTLLRCSYGLRAIIPSVLPASARVEYNAHVFDRQAALYISAANDGLYDDERALVDRFEIRAGRALCLGCGAGREALALAARGLDVTGVDQVPMLIAHAGKQSAARGLTARFIQADFSTWDPRDARFDYVFLLGYAICYVPSAAARRALLKRLRGIVAPGGLCILNYFAGMPVMRTMDRPALWRRIARIAGNRDYDPGDRIMGDDALAHHFESDDDFRREAESAGFRAIEIVRTETDRPFAVLRA